VGEERYGKKIRKKFWEEDGLSKLGGDFLSGREEGSGRQLIGVTIRQLTGCLQKKMGGGRANEKRNKNREKGNYTLAIRGRTEGGKIQQKDRPRGR